MKTVLLSIKPKWCSFIANGKKTVEVRKTRPKLETPFKAYIYCTNAAPYLVYGDRFNGQSFITEYSTLHGYSRKRADEIWGIMNGKIIGEFVCDYIFNYWCGYTGKYGDDCLSYEEQLCYLGENVMGYGWHISDLVIYDKPKELSEFKGRTLVWRGNNHIHTYESIKRPPQSWCYVEV